MKNFKRITALALCLALLAVSAAFSTFAAEYKTDTFKSAQNLFEPFSRAVNQGDTFDVVIKLQSDLPVVDGTVKLSFDSSFLRVTDCT
ncbi:MAG: hypothetical protein IJ725_04805, partial [Ruminococcus sp.]|nr:hypothetical protein [Ruminococcus sp.]